MTRSSKELKMKYLGVATPEEAERLGVARSSTVISSPPPKHLEQLRQVKQKLSQLGQEASNQNPPVTEGFRSKR